MGCLIWVHWDLICSFCVEDKLSWWWRKDGTGTVLFRVPILLCRRNLCTSVWWHAELKGYFFMNTERLAYLGPAATLAIKEGGVWVQCGKKQPGENMRVIQKISEWFKMQRALCSDLLWERVEKTHADGITTRIAASPWWEKRVRTALGGKTIASVFSGDVKQFAARLVGFILPRRGSWHLPVTSRLGSFIL